MGIRKWIAAGIGVLLSLTLLAGPVVAKPREARLPLHDGKVHLGELSEILCREMKLGDHDLPDCGRIGLSGLRGSVVVAAMNQALGEGCRLSVRDDQLVVRIDAEKLPKDCAAMKRTTRLFTALASPEAAADQAAFHGLDLPKDLDPGKPLVVMVHGLDCDKSNWRALTKLLAGEGYQVAYFTYPSDQPIADSAEFFGRHLAGLRQTLPKTPLHVLAHSMGGLVARTYIEGPDYCGGVDRLILLATPNAGSDWAKYRLALEAQEHYSLSKHEPKWRWTWLITDGLGEAGTDLKPGSKFLKELNARPRRDGVRYTIVAGSKNPAARVTANCLDKTAGVFPDRWDHVWGFRHYKNGLKKAAAKMGDKTGESDGPVEVESARLEGVDDFVVLPVDHSSIYLARDDQPPAAWETIRDRLKK